MGLFVLNKQDSKRMVEIQSLGDIEIRPICAADSDRIRQIWADGLQQTVEASNPWMRPVMSYALEKLRVSATTGSGDMVDLVAHWDGADRQMYAAVRRDSGQPKVVGCIGVKLGVDEKSVESRTECTVCTVWRMSVDGDSRRMGVGAKLMQAAEAWASSQGIRKLQLITGNPIASVFYINKCGFRKLGWLEALGPWYEKDLCADR